MLKMVDGTGIIGVDMVCPLGGAVSPPQPPNYDNVEMEGMGSLTLQNSLKAPLERLELIGNSTQGENPAPDNPQEIKSVGKEVKGNYLLDLKITGKNLFNLTDNYIWGWFAGHQTQISLYSVNAVVYMPCKPNTTYTIYGRTNINGNNNVKNRVATANDFPTEGTKLHNIAETQLSNPVTITTDELSKYLVIMAVTDNECNIYTREQVLKQNVSKMMVITGNTPTPYEPYTEQTVQIALDEPLRGIGEYKDMLTKDGVVRKIYPPYEINLNDLRDGGYEKTNTVMFSVKVQNKTVGYASLKPSILCNILPDCGLQTGNIYNDDKECIAVGGGIVLFRVNKSRLKDISSFEATKQSFIELIADKKMIVEYALETPVTEPLPESVQQQLQALHTENGITHVFADSGEVECGIKLTYRKEI